MKIAISAESTIDLSKDVLEKYDIHILPFTVILGGTTFKDGEITPKQIFDYVEEKKVLPKTSAVNEFEYEDYFSSLLKDYDAVVHYGLSSGLTSSTGSAIAASKKLKNVYVVDTLSLSSGIALLTIQGSKMAKDGLSAEEIYNKSLALREKVQCSFVLNTLEYLYKGGRCTGLQRFGSILLRIKPEIIMENGKLITGTKFHGKSSEAVKNYCEDILEKFPDIDDELVFVTHSGAKEETVELAKEIVQKAGFKNIIVQTAGATISSHCGPKCLGILYLRK